MPKTNYQVKLGEDESLQYILTCMIDDMNKRGVDCLFKAIKLRGEKDKYLQIRLEFVTIETE